LGTRIGEDIFFWYIAFMADTSLKQILEPFPGIRDFIFVPPAEGDRRTWIYGATEDPQLVLDFHISSFISGGWRVREGRPDVRAEKEGAVVSVSTLRRNDETRIIYELQNSSEAAL
jgi:hypothetical protein